MKSLSGKFASTRGWALLLILFLGAGLFVAACGDEETPTPTTPTPTPPAPPPPDPEPPAPEKPATPAGLQVSARTADSITWTWTAVDGATGYLVQASRDETFDDTDQLALTAETSFTVASLPPETSVYVRVAAGVLTAAAPSLDPDDYLLSDWTTHVTGMTDAAAAQAPAAPTNVRGTGQGSNYIEWSWDAVSGAAGYHAQFSRSTDFSDPDADRPLLQRTSVRISNLPAETDGYLRVRAYTGSGTGEDTLFGDWSATSMSSTGEPPPPPAPTALDAPTGLSAGSVTTTSVTLTWSSVIDADSYEVQQQPADGSWTGAACNGGDSRVDDERCEVSGLTRGNDYSFRVRAHPDPNVETLEASGWSSTASARTSGTPPSAPVTGGDDAYEITWESAVDSETNPHSITWTWSRPDDGRIRFLHKMMDADADERDGCPAIDDTWAGHATGGLASYSYTTRMEDDGSSPLSAGHVARLCVVPTWKDDNAQRYGDIFSAWAATVPLSNAAPTGTGLIELGPKVNSTQQKTTAIDWYVQVDQGFTYEVQTISAVAGDGLPRCGSGSGHPGLTSANDNDVQRFRLDRGLQTYTTYATCVRATNGDGMSGWTKLTNGANNASADSGEYSTLPAAPPRPTYVGVRSSDPGASIDSTDVKWRFNLGTRLPDVPASYTAKVLVWEGTTGASGTDERYTSGQVPDQAICNESTPTDYAVLTVGTIAEEGGSFLVPVTGGTVPSRVDLPTTNQTLSVYACVQAVLPGTGVNVGATAPHDSTNGPWSVGTTTVTLRPPP